MSALNHRILDEHAFHRAPVLIRDRVEIPPAEARLCEPQHSRSRKGIFAHHPFCALALALILTGCASAPLQPSAPSGSEQVKQRLAEIFNAAETKDLPRLDSYHWYGPQFTKFAGKGQRLDAAAAREGEHKGLSALAGLKLRADALQIDVFHDAAVATFTMVASIQSGAEAITKRERGTLVFVHHEGSWKIVHEHFSATE